MKKLTRLKLSDASIMNDAEMKDVVGGITMSCGVNTPSSLCLGACTVPDGYGSFRSGWCRVWSEDPYDSFGEGIYTSHNEAPPTFGNCACKSF